MTYRSKTIETFTCDYCGKEIFNYCDYKKLAAHSSDSEYKTHLGNVDFYIDICKECLLKIFEKTKYKSESTNYWLKSFKKDIEIIKEKEETK